MAEIEMGSLYDYNKNRVGLLKPLSPSKLTEAEQTLTTFMSKKENMYYMLLCRERNDYTIFRTNSKPEGHRYNVSVALYDIIPSRGAQIREIAYDDASDAYEIWVAIGDEIFLYLFFPCDNFVIDEVW